MRAVDSRLRGNDKGGTGMTKGVADMTEVLPITKVRTSIVAVNKSCDVFIMFQVRYEGVRAVHAR